MRYSQVVKTVDTTAEKCLEAPYLVIDRPAGDSGGVKTDALVSLESGLVVLARAVETSGALMGSLLATEVRWACRVAKDAP
jgi:hypothetical protein